MKEGWNMPLFNHLIHFAEQKPQSFHVPGHKNGRGYEELLNFNINEYQHTYIEALAKVSRLDVTELSHTDDLHDPQGVIYKAQQLAAHLYGADYTFFLVGGSTSGNIALILSICEPDDIIIIQRNVHKSIINGCKLAGVRVVFVASDIEQTTQLAVTPSLNTIQQAIEKYPMAKAVFLTNPNYYGLSVDLSEYAEIIHKQGMVLLVDEAHGAHYGIAPYAPSSAISYGADAVVQSTHKTLPALTMSAMLHINSDRIDKEEIQQQLAIVESSSPSYLLMLGIDVARAFMEHEGANTYNKGYQLREIFVAWLRSSSRFDVLELASNHKVKQDPYRLLLFDTYGIYNGYALLKQFECYGIWAEMASSQYVVLIWHPFINKDDLKRLKEALTILEKELKMPSSSDMSNCQIHNNQMLDSIKISEPVSLKKQRGRKVKDISLENATNKQTAELIVPYPPGIPVLYEGEIITQEHVDYLQQMIGQGARFQGSNLQNSKIKVFI